MRFEVRDGSFFRDGEEIKIISGAVHYFRNMACTWGDIFKKMRAAGFNCVETYCAWNMHEPTEGEFCFEGNLDIVEFIKKAQQEGLMVIVRPGPYICAEWEFGGLPWWLQCYDGMEIRCLNKKYVEFFEEYLDKIFERIKPLLCTNGGPIIMMQCENEYGYYGDDKEYLKELYRYYRRAGIDVPLFTSDAPSKTHLLDGSVEGCFVTMNFGSGVEERFKLHADLFPDHPRMCMEMWNGWFDAWGDKEHHVTSSEEYARVFDDMLSIGSANTYMFIGGTNFGFMNGANHYEKFAPDVTSYDYDALLSECGDVTEKYHAVRRVIQKHTKALLPEIPENRRKRAYGKVVLNERAGLFDNLENLSTPVFTEVPRNMEYYNQGYGYIAYQTVLNRDYTDTTLAFESIGDRAQVYINRELIGVVYVNDEELKINFSAKAGDILTVLVENMGRANFGPKMMRKKGIVGRCLIDKKIHFSWKAYPLSMTNLQNLVYSEKEVEEKSCFYKGSIDIDEVADTFIGLEGFKKGFVCINGFNIGRYWEIGPQKRLYIPASLLKRGTNEIVVFESDGINCLPEVELFDKPQLQ